MHDVIIVGAGSAGCVLANRLSADARRKVLLIEAGPADRNPFIHIPAGVVRTFTDPAVAWRDFTQEEPGLHDRRIYLPHGKTLGGSSAINGMAYVRGQPADYDAWRDAGNPGWGYADVLPLFRRSERWEGEPNHFRSDIGEMGVSLPNVRHPASAAFIAAGKAVGLPELDDYNGDRQEGISWLQYTVWKGRRSSTAVAFLKPARRRDNLTIKTGCRVLRVVIDGHRATGVVVRTATGVEETLHGGEIMVAAGAIGSPQLLMLSGVGPADHLRERGIGVVADLPGVGENLQDHLYVNIRMQVEPRFSMNSATKFPGYIPHAVRYLLTRKGLLAMATTHCVAFVRSAADVARPDVQIMFRPYAFLIKGDRFVPEPIPTVTASTCFVRPCSRGTVRLNAADPLATPEIRANYLTDPRDLPVVLSGLRWIRRILAAAPFRDHVRGGGEVAPGQAAQSDAELEAYCRDTGQTVYHPVGTCKMGPDAASVVGADLRVHGIANLRVCDASIMPAICSGNTNAAAVMIGERGADLIMGS